MRRTTLLLFTLVPAAVLAAQEPVPVEIFYTGRLMGHARIPDRQTTAMVDCRGTCGTASEEAETLLKLLKDNGFIGGPDQLLLGLGDNFGPNYAARTIVDGTRTAFKDHYVWLDKWFDYRDPRNAADYAKYGPIEVAGKSKIPFDNVAEFFRHAGYHALVPGKHDFTFGPERLRQIAKWLREKKSTALLGANLRIQTTRHSPAPSIPERFKNLPYTKSHPWINISLPKAVYPWARKFKISGLVSYSENCRETPADDLVRWKVDNAGDTRLTLTRDTFEDRTVAWQVRSYAVKFCDAAIGNPESIILTSCKPAVAPSLKPVKDKAVPTSAIFEFGRKLSPNRNYAVCLFPPAGKEEKPLCSAFSTAQPFWTWGRKADEVPPPYYRDKSKNVVVFGLLDPALQASLPVPNAGWSNENSDYDTIASITDPKEAYEQAYDECVAAGDCPDGVRRILLAQMPEERAAALARRIGGEFLAVIAEANTRQATPVQTIHRAKQDRPIVVSPGPIYTPAQPNHVQILLQRFSVRETAGFDYTHDVFSELVLYLPFENALEKGRAVLGKGSEAPQTLADYSRLFLLKSRLKDKDLDGWSLARITERAILQRMRLSNGADLALLQKRDLFRLPDIADRKLKSHQLPEVLDRLLWKGDFLLKIPVKGSVLEAAMARSQELAALDSDPNKVDTEEGRSLLYTGIYQDQVSKTWYVNGTALDKARLYQVAIPDYLAFGDTTYPQFKNSDGLAVARIRDEGRLLSLTGIVCAGLAPEEQCGESEEKLDLSARTLLDGIKIDPPDKDAGYPALERLWTDTAGPLVPDSPFKNADSAEKRTQGRRVFSIALEKIEGGFAKYSHNANSEKDRTGKFAGINAPQVVLSPESSTYNPAARVRARLTGRRGDFFVLAEETLNRVLTRDATEAYVTDLKQNLWGFESGYYARVFNRGLHRPEWVLLASLRHERNILTPISRIGFGTETLAFDLRKAFSNAGRIGVRWDKGDNTNWLEGGFQAGRRSQLLSSVRFAREDAFFECSATVAGPDSLAKCVGRNTNPEGGAPVPAAGWTAKASYAGRWRDGPFLRYRLDWPVLGRKEFAFVSEGNLEYYRDRPKDVATDTRLSADWSAAIRFKLWENLGLGPKYQLLYFDNKVQRASIASHNVTFGVEYRFELRPGLPLGKALRVPYPPK